MSTVKVTFSTMGRSSPASVAAGTGYYRYNGDQPCHEPDRSRHLPQNAKAASAKQKRMAEFARLRLEGKTKEEAGQEIGVSASTAGYYERDFQDEQRGEGQP